jgi:tetratricopeptide (TPR) repeat protein
MNRLSVTGRILILLVAVSGICCTAPSIISTTIPTLPVYHPFGQTPPIIVVANSFDVAQSKYRDNKEKQFVMLLNHAVRHTDFQIDKQVDAKSFFEEGLLIPPATRDSITRILMNAYNATHAILITSFNIYFEQTEVVVTESEGGGKSREAFYDIIVEIEYSFRDRKGPLYDTLISLRKFHSSRAVISGLLAAGPNIVSNTEESLGGVEANVESYLRSFFPGKDIRSRFLFVTKEFKAVGLALKKFDYKKAFDLSEQLSTSPDNFIAARAYYNCAVFLEYEGKYESAKVYLQEALKRNTLQEAEMMLFDYVNIR